MNDIDKELNELLGKQDAAKPARQKKKETSTQNVPMYYKMISGIVERMFPDAPLPTYGSEGAACADLRAYRLLSLKNAAGNEVPFDPSTDHIVLSQGWSATFGTGLKIAMPEGWGLDIKSRSGLAIKHGLVVANADGKVDTDYRGEIMIGLIKLSGTPIRINIGTEGDRIAQCEPIPQTKLVLVEGTVDSTERGEGGLGHTGIN